MCGIVGEYALLEGSFLADDRLEAMVASIHHRGPDHQSWIRRGRVALGVARLAIIDVAGSNQPIYNETQDISLVFNGEIYNFRALRDELLAAGHRFQTNGDGEVIVHGYEEWGTAVFEKLRGMFAIAVYDDRRQRLILARDRMGIKPLYLYRDGKRILFASEAKAFFASGAASPNLRSEMLDTYLTYRYVPAPHSIFQNVEKLPPGHYVSFDSEGETVECFHRLDVSAKLDISEADAGEMLSQLLRKSVEYRLQSDVPLGIFLSGGLDSGFLVAMAREFVTGRLDTFSIGFNRGGIYNEIPAASFVSKHFDTRQHSLEMDHTSFMERLPRAVFAMDEPMADPSSVPMQALSFLAKEHVKVVLSGEGGDELFAGYPRYVGEILARRFHVPHSAAVVGERLLRRFVSRSLLRGIEGIGIRDRDERHLFWQTIIPRRYRRVLLDGTTADQASPLEALRNITRNAETTDSLDRLFYFDLKSWLVEDLLLKKDKMGMSASIEARVPYLDQDVVNFALSLPADLKVKGLKGKYIFRRVIEQHMPAEVLARPKVGFAVPLADWFRHELADDLRHYLLAPKSFLSECLDARGVDTMCQLHEKGEDLSLPLYSLLVLELWGRMYCRGESPTGLTEELQVRRATA